MMTLPTAVEYFNGCIQAAAWSSTPIKPLKSKNLQRDKITEKRKARKLWQQTRHPDDKAIYNKSKTELSQFLEFEKNKKN